MARRGRVCVVAECGKAAAVGSVVCDEHRDTALGEQTDLEIMKMTQRLGAMSKFEQGEMKREAVKEFRRGVARGEYAALFSSEMMAALNGEGQGYSIRNEIGMMRVGMTRLLLEEDDPSRMAHSLARLGGALGKAIERQENWEQMERERRSRMRWQEEHREREAKMEEGRREYLKERLLEKLEEREAGKTAGLEEGVVEIG